MTENFEKIAAKFSNAKNGNQLLDAVKIGVSKGFSSDSFDLLKGSGLQLYARHKAELAAYLGKFGGPETARDQYFNEAYAEITSEGDFDDLMVLGECFAFSGLNDRAVEIFEEAFEGMEGDSEYIFHAMNAIQRITLGSDIESPDGCWYVMIPDRDYLLSTLNSVNDDFEARLESVDVDDRIRHYCTLAKCFTRVGESETAKANLDKAFKNAESSFEFLELLFIEAESETQALAEGGTSDEAAWVDFASKEFRNNIFEQAKKLASTEDEHQVLADMME